MAKNENINSGSSKIIFNIPLAFDIEIIYYINTNYKYT